MFCRYQNLFHSLWSCWHEAVWMDLGSQRELWFMVLWGLGFCMGTMFSLQWWENTAPAPHCCYRMAFLGFRLGPCPGSIYNIKNIPLFPEGGFQSLSGCCQRGAPSVSLGATHCLIKSTQFSNIQKSISQQLRTRSFMR